MTRFTTYSIAVNWCNNDFVLCNNITEVDPSVFDNARFNLEDEDGNYIDIYQYFLTDCSEGDVEWLEKTFDLKFSYSDLLDCFVLCVDHCGTGWNYVACEVKDTELLKINPEIEYIDSCFPPKRETKRTFIKGGKND